VLVLLPAVALWSLCGNVLDVLPETPLWLPLTAPEVPVELLPETPVLLLPLIAPWSLCGKVLELPLGVSGHGVVAEVPVVPVVPAAAPWSLCGKPLVLPLELVELALLLTVILFTTVEPGALDRAIRSARSLSVGDWTVPVSTISLLLPTFTFTLLLDRLVSWRIADWTLLTIAEFCPEAAPVCEEDPTLPVCDDVALPVCEEPVCEELLGDVLVPLCPLCDDGLLLCDPVVELCEELALGLVVWSGVVLEVPGFALVEPWVEGLVLCDPVFPVWDDELVPIWSVLEVEVFALSWSPAVELCELVWLGNVGGVLLLGVDVVDCAKP
jgi:hypothetical protein